MFISETRGSSRVLVITLIGLLAVLVVSAGLWYWSRKASESVTEKPLDTMRAAIRPQPVIDYNRLEKDQSLKELMEKRKAEYGMGKGIDMILKSDESLKIGNTTLSMQEILDKMRLKSGDIIEKDLHAADGATGQKIQTFGIHVVLPGDNIWNIHFQFLKDYFEHRGITLSPLADEPNTQGLSSGIGKILKFSENIVYIYNIKEKQFDADLDRIFPLNKIVVYHMDQIFAFLDSIAHEQLHRVMFDGQTLWLMVE